MKLSHYTIFSDNINEKNESIVFSTRTSEGFVISNNLRRIIFEGEVAKLSNETIEALVDKKILVESSENELAEIIKENKEDIKIYDTLYEVIQPTAYCQLACDYCGQSHTKDFISEDLENELLERIKQKLERKRWSSLAIGWFGGEPLVGLPQIRSLTKKLKETAANAGIPYYAKVVSNGLSLKKNIFLELVNELAVNSIEVTLDGIANYHDNVRHTKSKHATFDIIVSNLEEIFSIPNFKDLGCSLSIRCNVDHRNWEGVSPLIRFLSEKEFNKFISNFYVIGIYSWGGNDAHTKSLSKEEFADKEISWLIEMIENGFTPRLIPTRLKQVCMAVNDYSEMYDAFGNIFNCTEVSYTDFYKDTSYISGNLRTTNSIGSPNKPLTNWNDTIQTDAALPCHTCKMLPVCGGACPKSWHENMRACPTSKFNIKEKLELAYVIDKNNGDINFPFLAI